jgi:hypothetical protein
MGMFGWCGDLHATSLDDELLPEFRRQEEGRLRGINHTESFLSVGTTKKSQILGLQNCKFL